MSKVFYNAQNLTISNGFVRNPDRYYLEEYFEMLPALASFSTVTQLTNHSTAVTLNASSGIITLAAVALNATTNVEFTFNNSFIKSSSIIMLTMQDENTTNNCQLACACHTIADGSCKITLVNPHSSGNTSTTASKIHFLVINGAGTLNNFNKNFIISGTDVASATIAFDSARAGIKLTTHTTAADQVIISPYTTTNQSPWNSINWGTENQLEWECALSIQETSDIHVWAGLKLTNTKTSATDNDQVYFITEINNGQFFWNVVVSIGGVDYISRIPTEIVADKIYKLRISIDSSRFARVYINDVQYNITTVSASTTAVTAGAVPSKQLTDNVDLIPFIGIETDTGAKNLNVYYEKISRVLHE